MRARALAVVLLALVPVAVAALLISLPGAAGAAGSADAAAVRFLDDHLAADGRVVRHDQGGDTVSEGQAYAMLIALAIGDRERFDRAWGWARGNLQRPDGLFAWHWADGEIRDPEPASDADLDIARALVLAADRFGAPAFRAEGARIADAILREETVTTSGGPVLVAGPWARGDVVRLNPSYFSPRAYADLAPASREVRWDGVAATSLAIVDALTATGRGIAPNWAALDPGGAPVPAPGPGAQPSWGLDAARVTIRYAESCSEADRALAARAWPFLREVTRDGDVALDYTLEGVPTTSDVNPLGLVAAAAAAMAAGDTAERDALLDRAEALGDRHPTYYGAAWIALGRLMLTTDRFGPCTAPRPPGAADLIAP
jgi:endo-1,4-beta-D-glucanase Y